MYVAFELNGYQPLRKVSSLETCRFKEQAKSTFNRLSDYMLGKFIGMDVINAEQLTGHLFTSKKANVFLSHSHWDADQAYDIPDGVLKLCVRVAMAGYVLQWYHLDCSPDHSITDKAYLL